MLVAEKYAACSFGEKISLTRVNVCSVISGLCAKAYKFAVCILNTQPSCLITVLSQDPVLHIASCYFTWKEFTATFKHPQHRQTYSLKSLHECSYCLKMYMIYAFLSSLNKNICVFRHLGYNVLTSLPKHLRG